MSNIEQQVVQMKFDTAQFTPKVQDTLSLLDKLKNSLRLDGASKGLQEVSDTANRFSMDKAGSEVSNLSAKFTALQVAAVTALSNIVNKAVDAGLRLAKSLTIEPLTSGFREYETNLNSIQTILANTGLKGAEGLAIVTGKLDELNHYSDQTIYNFSEMAKNIGTFTAAGVKLDVATSAIKGIANLAAVSGSNAEQASAAMYQLSQALAAGKVTLEDWNSVVNAGMGGKVFQDSLIETARVHGVQVDDIIKKQGSFRLSLEKGWLTSEILTETLSKFTGELSAEQLKSMGYTEEQAKGILEMGQTAVDAATKVKTMTQLMGTLREAMGSGWAKTWQIIFGDFDEAKVLFTNVSNVLGGYIQKASDARNAMLQGWKDLGGRQALIDGLGNAFDALLGILRPIGQAFSQMFPAATAQQLFDMTVRFRDFMGSLVIGSQTANDLRRTFAGLFALLGIGWDIIKAGISFIGDLMGKVDGGGNKLLRFTGNIGDFLVALRKALQDGEAFAKFFKVLGTVIGVPIMILKELSDLVGKIFRKLDLGPADQMIARFKAAAMTLVPLGQQISMAWDRVTNFIGNALDALANAASKVWDWLGKVASALKQAFGGTAGEMTGGDFLKGLNVTAVVAFLTFLATFLKNFKPGEFLGGMIDALEAVTGALKGMQHVLNAAALLGIALAVGVMALSLSALAKIDDAGLKRAAAALAVIMAEMAAAFVAFSRLGTTFGATKLILISTALLRLGAAIRLIVVSVEALAKIPLGGLAKGLVGVIVLMGALVAAVNFLPKSLNGMVATTTGLLIMTLAIRILVEAVEDLTVYSWEELAKGLVGVGVLLASLALFTRFAALDKSGIASGLGIILIATSLKILASAVGDFVQYNWEQIARGMSGIAAGLIAIVGALRFLPEGAIAKAAGVLIVAASLKLIASAVADMAKMSWMEIARGMTVMAGALAAIALAIGFLPPNALMSAAGIFVVAASLGLIQEALGKASKMSWEEIAKGLVVLAASLGVMALALMFMTTALPGAAAVLVVAIAFNVLLPVLQALGKMTWEEIVKGLAALAGVFIILGLAGYVLGPLSPAILALAGAIALLGIAVLAAGLGVLAFGVGLTILASAGAGATIVLVALLTSLIGLIPLVMEAIAQGLVAVAKVFTESAPEIKKAMVALLNSILEAIIEVTPKIADLVYTLLDELLQLLEDYIPRMVDGGARIVIGVLDGMGRHVGEIVGKATDLVVNFLDALAEAYPRIIQAGIDLILAILNGIADAIRNNSARFADAGWNIVSAIIDGIINGFKQLGQRAKDAAINMAKGMVNDAMATLGIKSPSRVFHWIGQMSAEGLADGVEKYGYLASDAAASAGENMIDTMGKTLTGLSKVLNADLIDFNPTIKPVLDLSAVKKEAGSLSDILGKQPLDVSGSFAKAETTRATYNQTREEQNSPGEDFRGDVYNYTQNNTSPKALSREEIYRDTNSLIAKRRRVNANA